MSAASPAQQLLQPGRVTMDGNCGRGVARDQSTPIVLCPCKSSANPKPDSDVFLAIAAQLSLLVSLRRRRRLLVYLQMLEVIL